MSRLAVILFNLGGPDTQLAVQPFLFNLFNDRAIIGLPQPLRYLVAKLISSRRAPIAREIYEKIGGGSPLLPLTQEQAKALEQKLSGNNIQAKAFPCMRYWNPMTKEVVAQVKAYNPDGIILLPLYPQFSTTTTGSSLKAWHKEAQSQKLSIPTSTLCCYPTADDFISAHVELIRQKLEKLPEKPKYRILFSAHGLPEKIIAKGDPYAWQIEQTAQAIIKKLAIPHLDYQVCYQSRVGPLKWIGPSTEEEIKRAGKDGKALVIVPIAFVSEHSETLVELDMEYAHLAEEAGVPAYHRIAALGTNAHFITALAKLVEQTQTGQITASHTGLRICPKDFAACACAASVYDSADSNGKDL